MTLTYMIQMQDAGRLAVYAFLTDLAPGGQMGGVKYPQQAMALLKSPPEVVSLTPLDRRVLAQLVMHQRHRGNDVFFSGTDAHVVVRDMIETGRCYLWPGKSKPLRWGDSVAGPACWKRREDTGTLQPGFDVDAALVQVLPCSPPIAADARQCLCAPIDSGLNDDAAMAWLRAPAMDDAQCLEFIERMTSRFPGTSFPLPPHIPEKRHTRARPTPRLFLMGRDAAKHRLAPASSAPYGQCLLVRLDFGYGKRHINPADPAPAVRYVEAGCLHVFPRHAKAEAAARKELTDFGFATWTNTEVDLFSRVEPEDYLYLPADAAHDWADVLSELLPRLEAARWNVEFAEGYRLAKPREEDWYQDITQTARGWLLFETGIRVDDQPVNLLPHVHRYLKEHRGSSLDEMESQLEHATFPIPTQTCILLIEGKRLFAIIRNVFELFAEKALDRDDRLRVDAWRAAELAAGRSGPPMTWEPPPQLRELAHSLRDIMEIAPYPAPPGLETSLRPYQEQGFAWLRFLRDHRLGGILADDMGLGKTVQAIALLVEDFASGAMDLPALIVAPTSLLPNWLAELHRFAPDIPVRVLHGSDRHEHLENLEPNQIIITSYALLRRDSGTYCEHSFSTVIFDEAQAIKNPAAKVSRIAASLTARLRLCLTGTPIENHLGDLWALMRAALPGFLGSQEDFHQRFQLPIERDNHPIIREALRRRVRPLILRRTKDEVAPELPPKTTILQTVSLSEAQRDLYQSVRMAMSARIREEMAAKGLERSHIVILEALLKLRQICCDPRLSDKTGTFRIPDDSCKLNLLADLLPEMVEEGRRILLFSQFTSMLDLIKPLLQELKLPYVELRGSTRDRATPVRRFQAGEAPIFLISLKAGGTGLNLTAADTVIHYDPWWNPAVEAQATDRTHRIGQDHPVFVYRLVAEGTIESRIMELQESKRELSEFLSGESGNASMTLTADDIEWLLAPIATP